jgi:GH35 family endo-1,4-beta-xylanase
MTVPDHRTAKTLLRLRTAEGQALPAGLPVHVELTQHRMRFGSNLFAWERLATPSDNHAYADALSRTFNYVSVPFYWGDNSDAYPWDRAYEAEEGVLNVDWLMKMASWATQHKMAVKGHPLIFARVPAWVQSAPLEALASRLWGRVEREVASFAGLIDIWDVVNEPAQMVEKANWLGGPRMGELYQLLGPEAIIKTAFGVARETNPHATLVLNDWDTSPRFYDLVARCLDAGASIDAIGLQYHELETYGGPEQAWQVCERFAKLGLPLHFTELMLPSGDAGMRAAFAWQEMPGWVSTPEGEAQQAMEVSELYSVLFAHPAVEAITWWDLSDQGSYRGIPVGLLRADLTPKPAFTALRELIRNHWWTDVTLYSGEGGQTEFCGVRGDYRVAVGEATATFTLDQPPPEVTEVWLG